MRFFFVNPLYAAGQCTGAFLLVRPRGPLHVHAAGGTAQCLAFNINVFVFQGGAGKPGVFIFTMDEERVPSRGAEGFIYTSPQHRGFPQGLPPLSSEDLFVKRADDERVVIVQTTYEDGGRSFELHDSITGTLPVQ